MGLRDEYHKLLHKVNIYPSFILLCCIYTSWIGLMCLIQERSKNLWCKIPQRSFLPLIYEYNISMGEAGCWSRWNCCLKNASKEFRRPRPQSSNQSTKTSLKVETKPSALSEDPSSTPARPRKQVQSWNQTKCSWVPEMRRPRQGHRARINRRKQVQSSKLKPNQVLFRRSSTPARPQSSNQSTKTSPKFKVETKPSALGFPKKTSFTLIRNHATPRKTSSKLKPNQVLFSRLRRSWMNESAQEMKALYYELNWYHRESYQI